MRYNPSDYETRDVQQDALFYVLDSEQESVEWTEARETKETEFFDGTEGVQREQLSLPPEAANWLDQAWTFDMDLLREKYLSGISIKEGTAEFFADFAGGGFTTRVSEAAKQVIEEIDPQFSVFEPMDLLERPSMRPAKGPYYHWIVNRRRRYKRPTPLDKGRFQDTTSRLGEDAQWEVTHVPAVREFLSDVPFWCRTTEGGQIAMRADAFRRLKAAGLTGLVETKFTSGTYREPWESVGHIY